MNHGDSMAVFTYMRFSPKLPDFQTKRAALDQYKPNSTYIEDRVKGYVPPIERPQFTYLLSQLTPGDEVVIWWLNSLSKNMSQCCEAIHALLEKGASLTTLSEPITFAPQCDKTQAMLTLLKGIADADHAHRLHMAEIGRLALKDDPNAWQQKYRGRPVNTQKHQKIAQLLLSGMTLQEVATATDTSLSTVKRVKAKIKHHDDEGSLRTRNTQPENE